jgi:monoamine oxidase
MTIDRRKFLIGTAATASLAWWPRARAWTPTDTADVIVVGAGLSGLQAAMRLEQAGLRVLVLEGRDRVGGKVLTFSRVQGVPEAGGNTIGGDYKRLLELAPRIGITLEDQVPRMEQHADFTLVLDGRPMSKAEWLDSPRNTFQEPYRQLMPWQYTPSVMNRADPLKSLDGWYAPEKAPLDVSMEAFLKAQGASDATIKIAYDTMPTYGMSSRDISALLMDCVVRFTSAQRDAKPALYQAKGGNQRIPEAMARQLKEGVRFGQTVTAIANEKDGVQIRTSDGGRYVAKVAVCALPFATLRKLKLEPSLSGVQARAVRTLPHQLIHQTALHVTRPFWEADGLAPSMWTDSPIGRVAAIYHGQSDDEVSCLMVTSFGPGAAYLDRMDSNDAARYVVSTIEEMRPAAKGTLAVIDQQSWARDSFSLGAWSYFNPGTVTQFLPAMNQPNGRIHFCGEQTALAARGMEGALETGARAASEVLAQLA